MMHNRNTGGYTLLEIAVSITIVALILAGILVGKYLVRSAEIRAIMSESDLYKGGVEAYKLKYEELPGDAREATRMFGAKSNCNNPGDYSFTCNGNGNGRINISVSTIAQGNETFLFWQHLTLAELIPDRFNGMEGPSGAFDILIGRNTPLSKISGAAWSVINQDYSTDTSVGEHWRMDYKNFMTIGIRDNDPTPPHNGWNHIPLTTPAENFYIDQKVDDGKPGTGKFIARYWSLPSELVHYPERSCTLAVNDTDFEAAYNLQNENVACQPQFIDAF